MSNNVQKILKIQRYLYALLSSLLKSLVDAGFGNLLPSNMKSLMIEVVDLIFNESDCQEGFKRFHSANLISGPFLNEENARKMFDLKGISQDSLSIFEDMTQVFEKRWRYVSGKRKDRTFYINHSLLLFGTALCRLLELTNIIEEYNNINLELKGMLLKSDDIYTIELIDGILYGPDFKDGAVVIRHITFNYKSHNLSITREFSYNLDYYSKLRDVDKEELVDLDEIINDDPYDIDQLMIYDRIEFDNDPID